MDKFGKRFPYYFDDSDYQTNAPSYYDDLARKNKLIEFLANKIWDYEKTLDIRLDEISDILDNYIDVVDGKIEMIDFKIGEGFNQEINTLLVQWVADGTLDHIINETIFSWKVDQTEFDASMHEVNNKTDWVSVNNFPLQIPEVDDTGRIQRATDTGKSVFFPDGEYVALNVKARDNMHWWGVGGAVIKLPEDTTEGSIIYHGDSGDNNVSPIKNIQIENMTFDSNGASGPLTSLVSLTNPYRINFHNVLFNIAYIGVELSSTDTHSNYLNHHDVNFIGSTFTQNDIDVPLSQAINTTGAIHGGTIDNCTFINLRVKACARIAESEPSNATVFSSSNWNIINNRFRNIKNPSLSSGTGLDPNGLYIRGIFFNISGNDFYGVEGNNIDAQNTQIYPDAVKEDLNDMRFLTISNNRFVLKDEHLFSGEAVVHLRNSHVIVSNNSFYVDCTSSHKVNVVPVIAKWGNRLQVLGNNFRTKNIRSTIQVSATETYNLDYEDVIIANNTFEENSVLNYGAINLSASGSSTMKKAIVEGNTFKGSNRCVRFVNSLVNGLYGQIEHFVFSGNSFEGAFPFSFVTGSPLKIESDVFANYTFYVDGVNGDDTNARITEEGSPAKTMHRVLNMLPDICNNSTIEIILADGNHDTILLRTNLIMNGTLKFIGNVEDPSSVMVNRISFNDSLISNLVIEGVATTNESYGFSFNRFNGRLNINNSNLYSQDGLILESCNRVEVIDCDFNNSRYGISATNLTNVLSSLNTGSSTEASLRARSGSVISKAGSQATGTEETNTGGVIR